MTKEYCQKSTKNTRAGYSSGIIRGCDLVLNLSRYKVALRIQKTGNYQKIWQMEKKNSWRALTPFHMAMLYLVIF